MVTQKVSEINQIKEQKKSFMVEKVTEYNKKRTIGGLSIKIRKNWRVSKVGYFS